MLNDSLLMLYTQINGGPLLTRIQEHVRFSEHEAAQIIKEIASGLDFLHKKGIAHRDLKPENILCVSKEKLCPIKICDFDLGSGINFTTELSSPSATPLLLTPVSVKMQFIIEFLISNKQTNMNKSIPSGCQPQFAQTTEKKNDGTETKCFILPIFKTKIQRTKNKGNPFPFCVRVIFLVFVVIFQCWSNLNWSRAT